MEIELTPLEETWEKFEDFWENIILEVENEE